jgi:hypothetical protein
MDRLLDQQMLKWDQTLSEILRCLGWMRFFGPREAGHIQNAGPVL